MYSEISHENDISLEDQERRAFMNNSSIHSYNHTTKKDRIIRVTNGRIFRDGKIEHGDLWIQNGKILDPQSYFYSRVNSTEVYADEVIDAKDMIVCPGFIDIQINGSFGYDFSDPTITMDQIHHVTRNLLASGCTAICPTIITSAFETYHRNLQLFAYQEGSVENGAAILGAHCEGPFISPQRSGAHPPEYVRDPKEGKKSVLECYGDVSNIRLVTMAPELEGALDAYKFLTSKGITVSMGHTAAHLNQAIDGVSAGATLMTHLFNAMSPFHHRDPGIIGVLGMPTELSPYYSIIVDGIHIHPFAVRFAWKADGERCVLITDAMAAAGLPDGHYKLGRQNVVVADNKAVLEENHDTLAGSIVHIDACVRNYVKFTNCSIEEALRNATINPARAAHIHHKKGSLDANMDADFIFLDDQLNVHATFVGGDLAW
ncbi:hypothetical protein WA588_001128, partial [Blastocystis sp. NMH]